MSIEVLPNADVRYLDRLLLDRGLVCPAHCHQLQQVPPAHLKVWCVRNGVYQIPTWELIGLAETRDQRPVGDRNLRRPVLSGPAPGNPHVRQLHADLAGDPRALPAAPTDANRTQRLT